MSKPNEPPICGAMIYVPTNRECLPAIEAYAREAAYLHAISRCGAAFVLVESNHAPHTASHAASCRALHQALPCRVIYMDLSLQQAMLLAITERAGLNALDSSWLDSRLIPEAPNYSAGPNKAALLAVLLGVQTLHRRDSDTLPAVVGDRVIYPCKLEHEVLGKPWSIGDANRRSGTDRLVYCAGTDYDGRQAFNREGLDYFFLIGHERIHNPGLSEQALREKVDRKYINLDTKRYVADQVDEDDAGRTEMGAVAFYESFRHLPEMPIDRTLGCDYFLKGLHYRLGSPVLYHNRQVVHASTSDDAPSALDLEYAFRDARFKLLRRVWVRLNDRLETSAPARRDPAGAWAGFSADWYADALGHALKSTPRPELSTVITDLARLYEQAQSSDANAARYQAIATSLDGAAGRLIDEVLQGTVDYIRLIRMWPKLVDAASSLDAETIVPGLNK